MPGWYPQRRGTARTLPNFFVALCIFYVALCIFCVVLFIVCFVTFPVLFVCICVLNNCHRVATQLQLNIKYIIYQCILILIYLLTAVGLTPGGSCSVHIYTQTIHRTTQLTTLVGRLSEIWTQSGQTNWEECRLCPVFVSYTLAFVLQLRKKHRKTSVRVAKECQLAQ
jgi:hypothetical protein